MIFGEQKTFLGIIAGHSRVEIQIFFIRVFSGIDDIDLASNSVLQFQIALHPALCDLYAGIIVVLMPLVAKHHFEVYNTIPVSYKPRRQAIAHPVEHVCFQQMVLIYFFDVHAWCYAKIVPSEISVI